MTEKKKCFIGIQSKSEGYRFFPINPRTYGAFMYNLEDHCPSNESSFLKLSEVCDLLQWPNEKGGGGREEEEVVNIKNDLSENFSIIAQVFKVNRDENSCWYFLILNFDNPDNYAYKWLKLIKVSSKNDTFYRQILKNVINNQEYQTSLSEPYHEKIQGDNVYFQFISNNVFIIENNGKPGRKSHNGIPLFYDRFMNEHFLEDHIMPTMISYNKRLQSIGSTRAIISDEQLELLIGNRSSMGNISLINTLHSFMGGDIKTNCFDYRPLPLMSKCIGIFDNKKEELTSLVENAFDISVSPEAFSKFVDQLDSFNLNEDELGAIFATIFSLSSWKMDHLLPLTNRKLRLSDTIKAANIDLDQFQARFIMGYLGDCNLIDENDFLSSSLKLLLIQVFACSEDNVNNYTKWPRILRSYVTKVNPLHIEKQSGTGLKKGTTFMTSTEIKSFYAIPTHGSLVDPFYISVKNIQPESIVNATRKVALFLSKQTNFIYEMINIELSERNKQQYDVAGGVLLPLLTLFLLLVQNNGSLECTFESFNHKKTMVHDINITELDVPFDEFTIARNYIVKKIINEMTNEGPNAITIFLKFLSVMELGNNNDHFEIITNDTDYLSFGNGLTLQSKNEDKLLNISAVDFSPLRSLQAKEVFLSSNMIPINISKVYVKEEEINEDKDFDENQEPQSKFARTERFNNCSTTLFTPQVLQEGSKNFEEIRSKQKDSLKQKFLPEELMVMLQEFLELRNIMSLEDLCETIIEKNIKEFKDFTSLFQDDSKRFKWKSIVTSIKEKIENDIIPKDVFAEKHLKDENGKGLYNGVGSLKDYMSFIWNKLRDSIDLLSNNNDEINIRDNINIQYPMLFSSNRVNDHINAHSNVRYKNSLISKISNKMGIDMFYSGAMIDPLNKRPITISPEKTIKSLNKLHYLNSTNIEISLKYPINRIQCYYPYERIASKIFSEKHNFSLNKVVLMADSALKSKLNIININKLESDYKDDINLLLSLFQQETLTCQATRVEHSIKANPDNYYLRLKQSITILINLIRCELKYYSAKIIFNLRKATLLAMKFIIKITAISFSRGNGSFEEFCDIFRNMEQYLLSFLNGRVHLNGSNLNMRRLSMQFCRPIFKSTWSIWDHVKANFNINFFINKFHDEVLEMPYNYEIETKISEIHVKADSMRADFLLLFQCNSNNKFTRACFCVFCGFVCDEGIVNGGLGPIHMCNGSTSNTCETLRLLRQSSINFYAIKRSDSNYSSYLASIYDELSRDQKDTVRKIVSTLTDSHMLTGPPGVGKSTVCKYIRLYLILLYESLVPIKTIAFTHATKSLVPYASTFHSLLGIKGKFIEFQKLANLRGEPLKVVVGDHINEIKSNGGMSTIMSLKCLKVLFIEETQQIKADYFNFLNIFLQVVKGSSKPFGGVKLIINFDILQQLQLQIHPELKKEVTETATNLFFEDSSFKDANFQAHYLNEQQRTSDELYTEIIKMLRMGCDNYEKGKLEGNNTTDRELLDKLNDPKLFGYKVPFILVKLAQVACSLWNEKERRKRLSNDYCNDFRVHSNLWYGNGNNLSSDDRSDYIRLQTLQSILPKNDLPKSFVVIVTEHTQKFDMLSTINAHRRVDPRVEFRTIMSVDKIATLKLSSNRDYVTNYQYSISLDQNGLAQWSSWTKQHKSAFYEYKNNQYLFSSYKKLDIYIGMVCIVKSNVDDIIHKGSLAEIIEINSNQKITLRMKPSYGQTSNTTFTLERTEERIDKEIYDTKLKKNVIYRFIRSQFPIIDASVVLCSDTLGHTFDVPILYVNSRMKASDEKYDDNSKYYKSIHYGWLSTIFSRANDCGNILSLHKVSLYEASTVHPKALEFEKHLQTTHTLLQNKCSNLVEEAKKEDNNDDHDHNYYVEDDEQKL